MECQEGSYQRLQEKLGVYNPLFEYVDMGASSDFGPYYIIPYQDDNDSISGCIIYPVDEVLDDMEKRSFDGLLGNPIDFDSEYLQHEIPITRRFLYSSCFLKWKQEGLNPSMAMTSFAQELLNQNQRLSEKDIELEQWGLKTRALTYNLDDVYVHIYYYAGRYSGPQHGIAYGLSVPTLMSIVRDNFYEKFPTISSFAIEHIGYCELEVVFSLRDNAILKEGMGDYLIDEAVDGALFDCFQMYYTGATMQYTYRIPTFDASSDKPPYSTGGTYIPPQKPTWNNNPDIPNLSEDCSKGVAGKYESVNIIGYFGEAKKDSIYNKSDYQSFLNKVHNASVEYSCSYQQYLDTEGKNIEHVITSPVRGEKYKVQNTVTPSTVATIHNHINGTPPSFRDVLFTAKMAKDSTLSKYKVTFIYNSSNAEYYALYIKNRSQATNFSEAFSEELDEATNNYKKGGKLDRFLIRKGLSRDYLSSLIAILDIFDSGISLIAIDKDHKATSYNAEKEYKSNGKERKYLKITFCKDKTY